MFFKRCQTPSSLFLFSNVKLPRLLAAILLITGIVLAVFDTASAATPSVSLLSPKNSSGPRVGPIKVKDSDFVDSNGNRFFVSGVNYEGNTDRAWAMWNDDKFDSGLISNNLGVAAAGGYNTIRVFIQPALRDDIISGKWYKLDKLIEIAAQNNIQVLITLADYDELDLGRLAKFDTLVAKHFAGSPDVLGYDLKNEPQFADLALATYPDGATPPLQTDTLIQAYGERITQAATDSWRGTPEGQKVVPSWLNQRQAYIFANAYKIHQNFMDESVKWTVSHTGTSVIDWLKSPDSVYWKQFIEAIDGTLSTWIKIRQSAIREGDAEKPTTIGQNVPYFAYLKANDLLSFVSLHRFEPVSAGSIGTTLNMLEQLRSQHPTRPIVLEEFGYSNVNGPNRVVQTSLTASYEAAIWLYLYSRGYAGGFKWMLTNYIGSNPEENNYGLLDDQTKPKPSYFVSRAIHRYIAANRVPTGNFILLESRDGRDVTYMWVSNDTIFSNLKDYTNNRLDIHLNEQVGWQAWWPSGGASQIIFSSAGTGRITLDLSKFFPAAGRNVTPTLSGEQGQQLSLDRKDNFVSFAFQPGSGYTVNMPLSPGAFQRANPLVGPNTIYFKETGHNLAGAFKDYWEKNGGLYLYGFPISDEFQEGGYTVQYFERNRFEYHSEAKGTQYEVQLGLLGLNVTAGRKEGGDAPFQAIAANSTGGKTFFRETGHTLGGPFLAYWQKYGGLPQFGFPLTEEFAEVNSADGKTYIVQYFERARFEYHPEFKGTPNEVLLGLLGTQIAKSRGWL